MCVVEAFYNCAEFNLTGVIRTAHTEDQVDRCRWSVGRAGDDTAVDGRVDPFVGMLVTPEHEVHLCLDDKWLHPPPKSCLLQTINSRCHKCHKWTNPELGLT
jgi:hypothetical protein